MNISSVSSVISTKDGDAVKFQRRGFRSKQALAGRGSGDGWKKGTDRKAELAVTK